MASANRPSGRGGSEAEPPKAFANVPASPPALDHSFTLQMMIDVQKSVATLTERTDTLTKLIGEQSNKIDKLRTDSAFVKGACWVIGFLLAGLWAVAMVYISKAIGKLPT